jgi:3-oxoacyl-[acyl-carrier protein] reductase
MHELQRKVAVVTGGSRGIGAAVARRLGADGAAVVVAYSRNEERARRVVDAMEADGSSAIAVRADVSSAEAVRELFDRAESTFGGVDIVVANAGVVAPARPLAEATDDDYETAFAVNVRGVFFVLREAALRIRDGGRVISVSSIATALSPAQFGIYGATKGAVEQLTRSLAKELAGRGVTVNIVSPGATDTDMLLDEVREEVPRTHPRGRIGQPAEIADAIALLASERARWITGENVAASGGE